MQANTISVGRVFRTIKISNKPKDQLTNDCRDDWRYLLKVSFCQRPTYSSSRPLTFAIVPACSGV